MFRGCLGKGKSGRIVLRCDGEGVPCEIVVRHVVGIFFLYVRSEVAVFFKVIRFSLCLWEVILWYFN